jgi:hypothetical protein
MEYVMLAERMEAKLGEVIRLANRIEAKLVERI